MAAAETLAVLLSRESPVQYVGAILETLKYPGTAGEPTNVLIDALRWIAPEAPGKEAGLDAILKWIARTYPSLGRDLDALPRCPLTASSCATRVQRMPKNATTSGYEPPCDETADPVLPRSAAIDR